MIRRTIKVTFTEKVLGSQPADPELYSTFIGSKAPDAKSMEEEIAIVGAQEYEEKSMTVFPRTVDGTPCITDWQMKGFFKGACSDLQRNKGEEMAKHSCKLKAFKKVIDGCIFPFPRRMPIEFQGEIGNLQRPLRAQTMQGERICLANSETLPEGSSFVCTLEYADMYNDLITEWLNYGRYKGLCQWRNAGWGRFTWTDLSVEKF